MPHYTMATCAPPHMVNITDTKSEEPGESNMLCISTTDHSMYLHECSDDVIDTMMSMLRAIAMERAVADGRIIPDLAKIVKASGVGTVIRDGKPVVAEGCCP